MKRFGTKFVAGMMAAAMIIGGTASQALAAPAKSSSYSAFNFWRRSTTTTCSHSYYLESNTATCKSSGYLVYRCSKCNNTYTETAKALGHNYAVSAETSATCLSGGTTTYTCTRCGTSHTDTIDALGHNYQVSASAAATCTGDGYVTYTCTNCNDSYTEVTETATGHQLVSGSIVAATCTTDGHTSDYHCDKCGYVAGPAGVLKALGHDYANGTCTRCGAVDETYKAPVEETKEETKEETTEETEAEVQAAKLGAKVTALEDGKEYAFVTTTTAANRAMASNGNEISYKNISISEGTEISEDMIWTAHVTADGTLFSNEADGTVKYIYQTAVYNGYGYDISLSETKSSAWKVKASSGFLLISRRPVSTSYYIRFYNTGLGFIAAKDAAGVRAFEIVR